MKNLTNNPGILWLPYTIQTMVATWSGTPNLSEAITSRYSTVIIEAKNEKRKRKIRNTFAITYESTNTTYRKSI